jgi:hypothetical protein
VIQEVRNACEISVRKPEGKKPIGKSKCRGNGNIKIHEKEIGWKGVEWFNLAQDRDQWRAVMNTVMDLRIS